MKFFVVVPLSRCLNRWWFVSSVSRFTTPPQRQNLGIPKNHGPSVSSVHAFQTCKRAPPFITTAICGGIGACGLISSYTQRLLHFVWFGYSNAFNACYVLHGTSPKVTLFFLYYSLNCFPRVTVCRSSVVSIFYAANILIFFNNCNNK